MNDTAADIVCRPIGHIRSRFPVPEGVPVQAAGVPHETATLEVLPAYAAGLRDIEGFDHLLLITHFHRCPRELLEVTPFLDPQPHGVFATRAPARPNRLGLSVVRLLHVEGRLLHFAGNDLVDGTPVRGPAGALQGAAKLIPARPSRRATPCVRPHAQGAQRRGAGWDELPSGLLRKGAPCRAPAGPPIKPYVARFDAPAPGRIGWFEGRLDDLAGRRADDRYDRHTPDGTKPQP